jgi:hypothetical protein
MCRWRLAATVQCKSTFHDGIPHFISLSDDCNTRFVVETSVPMQGTTFEISLKLGIGILLCPQAFTRHFAFFDADLICSSATLLDMNRQTIILDLL